MMEGRPLVVIGWKSMNQIRDKHIVAVSNLFFFFTVFIYFGLSFTVNMIHLPIKLTFLQSASIFVQHVIPFFYSNCLALLQTSLVALYLFIVCLLLYMLPVLIIANNKLCIITRN